MEDKVILVDTHDREIGTAEKLTAHREGALHRAFSIFVFRSDGQLLLQKRAQTKYHSGGLWSNTCCSHPRPQEALEEAAHRRLTEEMGFDCALKDIFSLTYKVQLGNDLWEHEYDHVFVGHYDGEPTPHPQEIDDWKWIDLGGLQKDIHNNPDRYTYWLRVCIDNIISHREQGRPIQEILSTSCETSPDRLGAARCESLDPAASVLSVPREHIRSLDEELR